MIRQSDGTWTFLPDPPRADPVERIERDAALWRKLAAGTPHIV